MICQYFLTQIGPDSQVESIPLHFFTTNLLLHPTISMNFSYMPMSMYVVMRNPYTVLAHHCVKV